MGEMRTTLRSRWWRDYVRAFRRCAACGVALRERYVPAEKTRRRVCPACNRITYINPKLVAGLVPVSPDGRVLLLRRRFEPGAGLWSYPAGFVELGETVEAAAARETREETGVRARVGPLIGIYSYADAAVVTAVFCGRLSARARPVAGDEALEVAFFRPDQIPWRRLAFRSTAEALRRHRRS